MASNGRVVTPVVPGTVWEVRHVKASSSAQYLLPYTNMKKVLLIYIKYLFNTRSSFQEIDNSNICLHFIVCLSQIKKYNSMKNITLLHYYCVSIVHGTRAIEKHS